MIAVGVGASRGCPPGELAALVDAALAAAGLVSGDVRALASADIKAGEAAVLTLARERGWPLRTFAAESLAAVVVPTPSATVARHVGTPSVAEAAALLAAAPSELLVAKRRSAHATCAIAAKVATATSAARPSPTPTSAPSAMSAPSAGSAPSPALTSALSAASRDDSSGHMPVDSSLDACGGVGACGGLGAGGGLGSGGGADA